MCILLTPSVVLCNALTVHIAKSQGLALEVVFSLVPSGKFTIETVENRSSLRSGTTGIYSQTHTAFSSAKS